MILELSVGDFDEGGLRAEGDSETCLLDHHLVVGAVTDGENVLAAQVQLIARFDQGIRFGHGIHDWIADLAPELPASKNQAIGLHPVKTDYARDWLGEGQKPPGDQQASRTSRLHGLDELFRARRNFDALAQTPAKSAFVETGE